MHVITVDSNIDPKCIKVRKPYTLHNKLHFEITYAAAAAQRVPLVIQSPLCIMPFNYSLYDDKYLQLNLQITSERFVKIIHDIKTIIYHKVKKIRDFTFEPSSTLRLYNQDYESVGVFDNNAKASTLKNLVKLDKIYVLFQFEKLVLCENNNATFMYKLLQIKKDDMSNIKTQCMIGGKAPPPPPPGPPPPPPPIFKSPLLFKVSIPKKQQQSSYKPPSLKEILDAKSKLKKSN